MKKIFSVGLIILFFSGNAISQEKALEKVVIMVGDMDLVGDIPAYLKLTLSDRLRSVLNGSGKYSVTDTEVTRKAIMEQARQMKMAECYREECLAEVGKALGAKEMITGRVTKVEEGFYTIDLKHFDIKTFTTINSVSETCTCKLTELFNGVATATAKLIGAGVQVGGFPPEVPPDKRTEAQRIQPQGYGILVVNTKPEGVHIYIESEDRGLSPQTIVNVPVGERTIVLAKEGYSTTTEVVRIERDKRIVLNKFLAPQTGAIAISAEPAGAHVYLDGKFKGVIPKGGQPLKVENVPLGTHTMKIEHPEYEPREGEVSVKYNTTEEMRVSLAVKPGKLLVTSTPLKAKVSIVGEPGTQQSWMGETPSSVQLPPGKYSVQVSLEGYTSREKDIEVRPNRSLSLNFELEPLPTKIYMPTMEHPPVIKKLIREPIGIFVYPLLDFYISDIGGTTYGGGAGYNILGIKNRIINLAALGAQFSTGELSKRSLKGTFSFTDVYLLLGVVILRAGNWSLDVYLKPSINYQTVSGGSSSIKSGFGTRGETGFSVIRSPICLFAGMTYDRTTTGFSLSVGGYF